MHRYALAFALALLTLSGRTGQAQDATPSPDEAAIHQAAVDFVDAYNAQRCGRHRRALQSECPSRNGRWRSDRRRRQDQGGLRRGASRGTEGHDQSGDGLADVS